MDQNNDLLTAYFKIKALPSIFIYTEDSIIQYDINNQRSIENLIKFISKFETRKEEHAKLEKLFKNLNASISLMDFNY